MTPREQMAQAIGYIKDFTEKCERDGIEHWIYVAALEHATWLGHNVQKISADQFLEEMRS